jgi:hypothetical protein
MFLFPLLFLLEPAALALPKTLPYDFGFDEVPELDLVESME